MSAVHNSKWKTLERCSPVFLFIVGAIFLLILIQGILQFRIPVINHYGFSYLANIFALIGVLGLYPRLSKENSRIADFGAVLAGLSAFFYLIVFSVNLITKLTESTAFVPEIFLSAGFMNFHVIIATAAYLLFCIALLHSEYYPSALGILMAVPVILILAESAIFISTNTELLFWASQISIGIYALVNLAMGYILWSDDDSITGAEAISLGRA